MLAIKRLHITGPDIHKYGTPSSSLSFDQFKSHNPISHPVLGPHLANLIGASLSASTWAKSDAGLKAFKQFELYTQKSHSWPLERSSILEFTTWCLAIKRISAETTKTYLAALATAHKLKGMPRPLSLDDNLVKMALKGAPRSLTPLSHLTPKPGRRAMSLPLLKILGHKISMLNWDRANSQAVWCAFNLAFFTSCRMGELLALREFQFDPTSTLTWADINFLSDDNIIIHLKSPKSGKTGGEFVDIFPFPGHGVCPVLTLNEHRKVQQEYSLLEPHSPVFKFVGNKFVTPSFLNKLLKQLLADTLDGSADSITCHSFRAGIPSALARFPDLASAEDIKGWGRWDSNCYATYTRLKADKKRAIFCKIASAILS